MFVFPTKTYLSKMKLKVFALPLKICVQNGANTARGGTPRLGARVVLRFEQPNALLSLVWPNCVVARH